MPGLNWNCDVDYGPCACGATHDLEAETYAMERASLLKNVPTTTTDSTSRIPAINMGINTLVPQFTREDLFALHTEMTARALDLMKRKNADYAKGGPFDNFKLCEQAGVCSTEHGIIIRMLDKLSRLNSILAKGEAQVKDESVQDTLIDLINYSVCMAGVLKEKQNAVP